MATQTPPAPPNLVVDPGAISDTLTEGQTATHTLTLSNTGAYPLSYRISAAETSASVAVVSAPTSRSTAPDVSGPVAVLDEAEYVDGEIVVRFVPGSGGAHRSAARASARARLKRNIPRLDMEVWELPSKGRTAMLDNLNVLRKNPNVLYAEPNYVVRALERREAAQTPQAGLGTIAAPSDPRFDDLWGLHNTGQTGGTEDADIDALEAWGVSTGAEGVVVAVIDTGADYTHPDLADNTWINADEIAANGIDDDANGYVDDVHGYDFAYHDADPMDGHRHGTHCAG
ncbi:MAG: S8 family serine peptidase, partial [Actinobacteria bacterium]|nr:S8 family serine peptidase [Actinomycetota bacterium]